MINNQNRKVGMKRIIVFLLVILNLSVYIKAASRSSRYCNKHLYELGQVLEKVGVPMSVQGTFRLQSVIPDQSVEVVADSSGVIIHIGFRLFSSSMLPASREDQFVYFSRFVERYLLELALLDDSAIQRKLREDRVKLSFSSIHSNDVSFQLRNFVGQYASSVQVKFATQNNLASVEFVSGELSLLRMTFPVNYELLTGYTKLESEDDLYDRLSDYHYTPDTSAAELIPYKDGILEEKGESFTSESVVSSVYYVHENDSLVTLFDKNYLPESVYSLFNGKSFREDVYVKVTQSLYGNRKKEYTLPLSSLLGYMREKGCRIFTGISKMNDHKIEGIVLANNADMGYQHVLIFTMNPSVFDRAAKHWVHIVLYGYIPIHNIKSFYLEKETGKR